MPHTVALQVRDALNAALEATGSLVLSLAEVQVRLRDSVQATSTRPSTTPLSANKPDSNRGVEAGASATASTPSSGSDTSDDEGSLRDASRPIIATGGAYPLQTPLPMPHVTPFSTTTGAGSGAASAPPDATTQEKAVSAQLAKTRAQERLASLASVAGVSCCMFLWDTADDPTPLLAPVEEDVDWDVSSRYSRGSRRSQRSRRSGGSGSGGKGSGNRRRQSSRYAPSRAHSRMQARRSLLASRSRTGAAGAGVGGSVVSSGSRGMMPGWRGSASAPRRSTAMFSRRSRAVVLGGVGSGNARSGGSTLLDLGQTIDLDALERLAASVEAQRAQEEEKMHEVAARTAGQPLDLPMLVCPNADTPTCVLMHLQCSLFTPLLFLCLVVLVG